MKNSGLRAVIVLILLNISVLIGRAQDLIPPFPVDPFYGSWSFYDPTNWLSDEGYAPNTFTNIINDESAWSADDGILNCNGLILDSTDPAFLNYNTVESNGHTNLSCTAGTIWFWFSPDWDSQSQGGTGPGDWGRFIDVGAYTTNATFGWWSLLVSPDGNTIYFSGQTNGATTNYLNAPISWTTGSWHLIGLTYTATNSILYIDDQVATNGIGVIYPPGHTAYTNGFWIGSDYSGMEQARGEFVDLESWLIQFPSNEFSAYYDEMLPEFGGGGFSMDSGVGGFSGGTGGGSSSGGVPSYVDGTNLWLQITGITNTGTSQTAYFVIWPPTNVTSGVYDLYYTTNLITDWSWVLRTGAGETNLTVTNLTGDASFFRLGLTNDTDGDGLSDAFEMLVSHTDPNNADQNTNSIPDGWEWNYFGNLSHVAGDSDAYGNSLYYDYANGFDPNIIQFTVQFAPSHINTNTANGTITVAIGVPNYYAVLVNDTNTADANWQPYVSSNIVVTLGSTNGTYNVLVGLRGLATNSWATWQLAQLYLNTTGAGFTVTNPVSSTVSVPLIQLQGLVNESLSSLTYDVSNAAGIFTNLAGYSQPEFYDTNLLDFTTNSFQCYDVALTNGLNIITLHATDLAGNTTTTNVSYTLDYSGDTTAPVLSLVWPTNGTVIGGSNFTMQAQVDDPTASVTVSLMDTNGDTNIIQGLVERSGVVWFNNLPLGGGTNVTVIIATDAAGNLSATNINVIQSTMNMTINALTSDQMNQASVTVTGSIGDASDGVTVNGVAATVNDDGTWEADAVPVNPNDTASLDVEVTDSSSQPVASQVTSQAQPAAVRVSAYDSIFYSTFTYVGSCGEPTVVDDESANWADGGGSWQQDHTSWDGECNDPLNGGKTAGLLSADDAPGLWKNASASGVSSGGEAAALTQDTKVMIVPSGQGQIGATVSYLVHVSAAGFSDLFSGLEGGGAGDVPLDPTTLKVNGQSLVSSGVTNDDGSVDGQAFVTAPAGAHVPLTISAAGSSLYTFNVQAFKTKEAWQQDVRNEIYTDTHGKADMNTYNPANGFMNNRQNLQAVYAFYQKLFNEDTNLLWAGLGKLAGAPVYAGLSDAQQPTFFELSIFSGLGISTNDLTTFQNMLITMNTNILQDLAWQSEAYYKGGLKALEVIYAGETNALDLPTINAWREIDDGISNNIASEIQDGNLQLAHREQLTVLQGNYDTLNATAGFSFLMSLQAKNPVLTGTNFSTVVPGGNICVFADRWNWITNSASGIWPSWTAASPTDRSTWVNTPLTTRASSYAQNLPVIQ